MADDKMTFFERLRGKRTHDIDLPNPSGQTDPRLRKPNVSRAIGRSAEGVKILRKRGLLGGKR